MGVIVRDSENRITFLDTDIKVVGDYNRIGDESVAILAPGFTEHRTSLSSLAKLINERDISTLTIDLPGQGDSGGNFIPEEITYVIGELADRLKYKEGFRTVKGVGNSIGGHCMIHAEQHQHLFESIVGVSVPNKLSETSTAFLFSVMKYIPFPVIKFLVGGFNKYQKIINENYRNLSFEKNNGQPFFGALRIPSKKYLNKVIKGVDEYAAISDKPLESRTLLLYGGNDNVLKIKNDKIPYRLLKMAKEIGAEYQLISRADHSINYKTLPDETFNHEPSLEYVSKNIAEFLSITNP